MRWLSLLALASCATGTPGFAPGAPFDAATARTIAANYDARVIRDKFGVPHIYGKRNADVAYGLAYAHAEDDWKNIEEVIRSNRGTLSEIVGESGAKSDDFILALGNTAIVNRDYDTKASPQSKAVVEGYAAGLNLWCASCSELRRAASSSTAWRMPLGWSMLHCSWMDRCIDRCRNGLVRPSSTV